MISLPGSNSWVDQVKRLDHWIKKQQEKKDQVQPAQPTAPVNNERKPK